MLADSPSASNQQRPSTPASERPHIQSRYPWQRPPTEQILGALQLLRRNNDVSRRQAFLLLDQGVETLFKTYLSLPASVTHTAMPENERIRSLAMFSAMECAALLLLNPKAAVALAGSLAPVIAPEVKALLGRDVAVFDEWCASRGLVRIARDVFSGKPDILGLDVDL